MTKITFTKTHLQNIKSDEDIMYYDIKESGLAIRIHRDVKTYYLFKRIKNKLYKVKIGSFNDLSIEQARQEVAKLKSRILTGQDIKSPTKNITTLSELFERFQTSHAILCHTTLQAKINQRDAKKLPERPFFIALAGH